MVDVSVIIVNYNTKKLTLECVDSVFKNTNGLIFEVIVVDNNSIDGSKELLELDDRIIFVGLSENIGFGRANNKGLSIAKGKYVFFLNSDTVLVNNAVKLFYDKMEICDNRICCLGTLLFNKQMQHMHSYGKFPTKRFELIWQTFIGTILRSFGHETSYYDSKIWVKGNFFKVEYITGADLFVRRSVIDDYGGFDEDFFMYYEETEMEYRFTSHGRFCYIYDAPHIIHLEGASMAKEKSLRKRSLALPSCFLYHKKTSSYISYILFRIIFIIFSIPILFAPKYSMIDKWSYIKQTCKKIN